MIKEKDKSVLFSCSVSVEGTFCCSKVNDSLWFEVYRFYLLFIADQHASIKMVLFTTTVYLFPPEGKYYFFQYI